MTASNFIWQEMSKGVIAIGPDSRLEDAFETMRAHRFRHLPVLKDQVLVGILSDRDISRAGSGLRVGDVMTRDVKTCQMNDRLGTVADIMIEHRIDALPVVNEAEAVIGIITSTDLLKYLRRTHKPLGEEPFERFILDLNDVGDCED